MTEAQFRRTALALPGVTEKPHFERTSFRVERAIIATLTRDAREAMVRVRPPDKLDALLRGFPEVFFSYGGWTDRFGSLGIRLFRAPRALVEQLLRDAHADLRAPPARPSSRSPRRSGSPRKQPPAR